MVEREQAQLERVDDNADKQRDYAREQRARETNWNLSHLTLSHTALEFFANDPNLHDLLPLADQICATNSLDYRGIELYRCMISSKILEKMAWADEDDETGFGNLDTARTYLFMLLDGTLDGYRGRLATVLKREYEHTEAPQQKKKFLGLF